MTRKDIGPSHEPWGIAPFKVSHCDTAPCARTLWTVDLHYPDPDGSCIKMRTVNEFILF